VLGLGLLGCAPLVAQVVINELVTSNGSTLTDEDGDSPDWFELYNAGDAPASLDGWGLSDARDEPFKWVLHELVLPPHGFATLYASGKDRQSLAVTPLDPATLPGLRVWLRADRVDAADPAQVRRSGDNSFVIRWNNAIAGGDGGTAADASQQPLLTRNGPGGLPALRFDGGNDVLRLPHPAGTNSFCVVAVYRTSQSHEVESVAAAGVGGTGGQRYLFGAEHGGDFNAGAGLSVGTNGVAVYEHGSGYMPALAAYQGAPGNGRVVVTVNYTDRLPRLAVQGVAVGNGVPSPRREVTAPVEIGAGAYGAFGGDLAEVLIFDRALTEGEVRGMERQVAARFGITLLQPRHTSFQLNAEGERLTLTRPDGTRADQVVFGPVPRDVSYGRQPDGDGAFYFFAVPTPGASNTTPGSVESLSPPAFSHPAGFYAAPFDLVLESSQAGADIRFTLDGSDPTASSPRYTAPSVIRSRLGTPNVLSAIPTVPGGPLPLGEVYKGWVVRARVFKAAALPSATVTRSYWVDARGRGRYRLPVVSLATGRDNFFDPARGIYIPGNAPGGNYSQRGPEWERPVHVELIESDGSVAFAQDAGVKIHGNTSQGFPIKGLDLDGTSGSGRQPFRYRVFPDRTRAEFEHFLLRPTGHDQMYAFMRDELMQSLAAETGAESQAARPCVVFLNGEYWGLHYLKEKEDAEFVGFYGDHPADDVDYLEGYASPKAGDTRHYDAMLAWIAAADLNLAGAYAELGTRMDLASYTDYKVCEIFFYRWDIGNHRLWRPRTPEGRWRWLQFDNDVGWGGFWAEQPAWEFDMLHAVLTPDGGLHGHAGEATTYLLRRLMTSPDFRQGFVNRFCDLLNSTLLPGHTRGRIDAMAGVLEPEMAEHARRWRSPASVEAWRANVQYLRDFADRRPGYMREHLARRFGLGPTAMLSLYANDASRGGVRVNTLRAEGRDGAAWSGQYFRGHPLRLTAVAEPGFRFSGWDGLPGVASDSVTVLLSQDTTIGARFEPNPAVQLGFENPRRGPDGSFQAGLRGPAGGRVAVEQGGDLRGWISAVTVVLDLGGRAEVQLSVPPGTTQLYLRARLGAP
jgi:hypothetical protein